MQASRITRVILITALMWCTSYGQGVNVGGITGIVTDSQGAALPGVNVEVRNIATNVISTATTNDEGNYLVANLIPGSYELSANLPGFKRFVRTGFQVQVAQTLRIDPVMPIGDVAETVVVSGASPLLQTETGSRGEVIDNRKITQLPLNGRNVYSLTALVPGAAPDNTGRIRINGARARSNEYLVDGVTQVNPETRGDPISPPPIDSIEEFKVLTNSFSAEYGNSAGGVISVATKSGANDFQVTLWEFFRNDVLNTRNFFAPPNQRKPVLRQNQFGIAGGGPVFLPRFSEGGPALYNGRNRTFFFADYEGLRVRNQSVFNLSVPTLDVRSGDFSRLLGPVIGTDSLGRQIRQGQIFDPATERTVNGVIVRDPFPNNVIPRDRFDRAALRLLEFYPLPTESNVITQNFRRANSTGNDSNRFDARLDHVITANNKIFGRYSYSQGDSLPNAAFRGATGDFEANATTNESITGALTSTLTSTKLNEVRLSYLSRVVDRPPYLADTNVAQQVGIANITTASGLPNIDISDVATLGSNFSGGFIIGEQQVYSLIDNFSLIIGRHSIKFGGEARFYRLSNFQPNALNGRFLFRAAQTAMPGTLQARTGNAFASFLLGSVNQTQYTQQDPGQEISSETFAGFVQDDFKLSRRLTLNLGLRYDLNTRISDTRDFDSTLDLASGRVLAGSAKPDVSLDTNNFAPRFGFALDLVGNQTTVLRGGYGIFFQPIIGGGGNPLGGLPKFPFEFTSNATAIGVQPVTILSQGPVRQQEFDPTDPRLGFGATVQIQAPNLAPYVQQWNIGLERSLGGNLLIGAAYIGSAGKKLDSGRNGYLNINQVPIEVVQQAARQQNTTTPNTAALRPYPNFNEIQPLLPRYGDSIYHSLQLKAERRFSNDLSFLASYTWSKSIDNASEVFGFTGGSWPQDVYNLRGERAVSTADVPHRLVASYVYELPLGANRLLPLSGLLNTLVGGWQINGITTLASGRPVDVEQSVNTTRTFSLLQRPNITGNPNLPRSQRTLERYFDTSVFSAAAPLNFGTSPRNPFRGPGLVNFDVALIKAFAFSERRGIEFRAEAFNVTNTPPFQLDTRTTFNPGLPLNQQNFGRITSAGPGRQIQFALKLKL